jgi:putative ABC transport system ATP-binding protein
MLPPAEGFSLAVLGLRHAYGSGTHRQEILCGLDGDFRPGEIAVILGPSGSGKTTLLTLVGALRKVQSGSVRVNGIELATAEPGSLPAIRRAIGFVFQNHNLLGSLTCLDNVTVSMACDPRETAASARDKARRALAQVGLLHLAGADPRTLAHGQRQRVALARALVHGPGIILADEPTASLDWTSTGEVVGLLRGHARTRGCVVLVATHDQRLLDAADRILALEEGRLVSRR